MIGCKKRSLLLKVNFTRAMARADWDNNGKEKRAPESTLTSKGGIERSEEGEGGGAQDECQADQTKLWEYDFIIMILYDKIIS